MNEPVKKKLNVQLLILIIFFIIFIALYFTQLTDLYEYSQYNKMSITKEAMEKFENDIASGKNVVIEDYIDIKEKNYTNNLSKLGNKTSNFFENFMTKGIKRTFKIIGAFFS